MSRRKALAALVLPAAAALAGSSAASALAAELPDNPFRLASGPANGVTPMPGRPLYLDDTTQPVVPGAGTSLPGTDLGAEAKTRPVGSARPTVLRENPPPLVRSLRDLPGTPTALEDAQYLPESGGAGTISLATLLARPEPARTVGTLPPGEQVPVGPVTPGATARARPQFDRPLMSLLDQTPVGDFLNRNQIKVYGWAEGSYTYNADNPAGRLNAGRLFDFQGNDGLVNQIDLTVQRRVDLSSHNFEVGGRIDLLYGSDARFVHANGMFDDRGFPDPQYQFDIPQLYVDLAIPVGNGLRVRLGKFEFFKPLDPNASPFFSHTFFYAASGQDATQNRLASTHIGGALPFTLTGATAYYEFDKRLNAEVGFSRGFDDALEDNNGAIDAFGRLNYAISDRTKLSFALITGPEINHDNTHYRTVGDLSVTHSITDDFAVLFDGEYGMQARPNSVDGAAIGGDAHWYGASGTAIYRINKYLSAAGRLEWYRDEQGFTTAVAQSLYEATVGVTVTPFPDSQAGAGFKVRPELRLDYSDHRYFPTSPTGGHSQLTAAIDAIYNF